MKWRIYLLTGAAVTTLGVAAGVLPPLAHAQVLNTTLTTGTSSAVLVTNCNPPSFTCGVTVDGGQLITGVSSGTTVYVEFYTDNGTWSSGRNNFGINFYSSSSYSASSSLFGLSWTPSTGANTLYQASATAQTLTSADYATYSVSNNFTSSNGGVLGNASSGLPWVCLTTDSTYSNCNAPPAPIISFYLPTNGGTTPDFSQWLINASNLSTSTLYRFDIIYNLSGGLTTYDDFNLTYSSYSSAIAPVNKSQTLTSAYASTTAWYAQAYLYSTSSTSYFLPTSSAIASTPLIFFTINPYATSTANTYGTLSGGETSSTILASTGCAFNTTSTPNFWNIPFSGIAIGDFEQAMCQVGQFLSIPNSSEQADITNRFNTLQNIVATKPPIGYFTLVKDDFSGITTSTASSTVVLMNASTTAAFSPLFDPLDVGLAFCVWLLGCGWLFLRMRHLEII